jgi:hypothetical protein
MRRRMIREFMKASKGHSDLELVKHVLGLPFKKGGMAP